jgi:type I restriction enzyme S subunit
MAGEWRRYEVSDLIRDEKLVIGDGYRAKNSELAANGWPFARAGNINDGFRFEGADRFPEDNLSRVGNKVSQPGDVVFTSKGTVGRFAFVRKTTPRFVYSPQLCFWRSLDHKLIDPRYLFYWMFGREFFIQFKGVAGQTDMAEYVSLTDQRRMHITLPPLTEQRAIARILGTLDDKIELNRRMNETLEEMARALFKSWFVDFDPVHAKMEGRQPFGMDDEIAALFPDSFEDSALGEIPKGWKVGTVSDIATASRDALNPADNANEAFDHYSIPAFDKGEMPQAEYGWQIKSNKFLVPSDAVLLSKLNPRIPRCWLPQVSASRRSLCSTEYIVALPKAAFTR